MRKTEYREFNRQLFESRRAELALSIEALARKASLALNTTGNAARGLIPGPAARERLAAALETAVDELWPLSPAEEKRKLENLSHMLLRKRLGK